MTTITFRNVELVDNMELVNNIEATEAKLEKLPQIFWLRVSERCELTIQYMERFKEKIHWNFFFEYNRFITVEMMEKVYKPLYDEGIVNLPEPHEMVSLNRRNRLSDDVISWLIIFTSRPEKMMTNCELADKMDLFWSNIFQNKNLSEEFKLKYEYINSDGDLYVGDRVHTNFCPHGILGGRDGDKYIILDSDQFSFNKDRVKSYFVGRASIYKGWEE